MSRKNRWPCPGKPEALAGQPIGMYHCEFCGEMQLAGSPHLPPQFPSAWEEPFPRTADPAAGTSTEMVAYPTSPVRMERIEPVGPPHTRPPLSPPSSFPSGADNDNKAVLCVLCGKPGAVEIVAGNGKPWCADCTALPAEERRRAGLERMALAERDQPLVWHYMSFADETGFLGACWVRARGMLDAIQVSHAHGCNGGGSVMCRPLPRHGEPPAGSAYVLHRTKDEVQRLFDLWTTRIDQP